jgi:sec-independent protein translocase protein TatB
MFDIAPSELLVVVLVAIVVIGPKDLPIALRTAGRWIGRMRRMSAHFRSGVEAMIREAELEEMEKKWREQNAAIMAQSAATPVADPVAAPAEPTLHPAASAEAGVSGSGLLSADEAEQFHAHMPATAPEQAPAAPPAHPPVSEAKAEAST